MKKSLINRKENRGITLIALVITIIVLLVLAGISIATLTGENGVLTKANDAKTETSKASAKEKVQVAVMGSYDNSGNINNNELKTNLNQVEGIDKTTVPETITDDIYPFPVTVDGHEVTIEKNGRVTVAGETTTPPSFDESTLTIGTDARNTDKYGWKVPEYIVKTEEFITGVWRLYYQDSNYTYLITDECIGSYKPSDFYTTMKNGEELKYQTGADVSVIGQRLNLQLLKEGTCFTSTNVYPSIRATAWLTDTSDTGMWSNYKNTDAIFAIGSPTVELLVASYNASGKSYTLRLEPTNIRLWA